jgi:hypothetical protein
MAGETTAKTTPTMVPAASSTDTQQVGALRPGPRGGMLRYGGPNRGGPGRPRDEVRQAALKAYAERIEALAAIADRRAMDYVQTKRGLQPVPAKLELVIRALAELRMCAGLDRPESDAAGAKPRVLQVRFASE